MKICNNKISKILGTNCGIYFIKNIVNNKVYIGSSKDIHKRINSHKLNLFKNKHHSKKLQKSYNKYGKDSFIFDILEICDNQNLEIKEKEWIIYFDSYKNGYNSTDEVGSPWRGKKQPINVKKLQKCKTVKMIDPNGNVVESYSIRSFADFYKISRHSVIKVLNGKFYHCRGYRKYDKKLIGSIFNFKKHKKTLIEKNCHPKNKILKFKLINPEGKIFTGYNLLSFAKKHNLPNSSLSRVVNGKANHTFGWRKFSKNNIGVKIENTKFKYFQKTS